MSRVGIVPDLLVWRRGVTCWVENKVKGSSAKWYADQLDFIASTRMNVIVAKTGDEAFDALRNNKFVSQTAKDAIAALLAISDKDVFVPNEIDPLLTK